MTSAKVRSKRRQTSDRLAVADFYDEDKVHAEMHRVFDICHGCRRCVNLCTAFPTLFDLIDEGKTGELDGVDRRDFGKVVDKCYLCDMWLHDEVSIRAATSWNVDFPHLMLRAKAVKFKNGGTTFRDKLLTSTDAVGNWLRSPWWCRCQRGQQHADRAQGHGFRARVHEDRVLPEYTSARFRGTAGRIRRFREARQERARQGGDLLHLLRELQRAGIGHDLLKILSTRNPGHPGRERGLCGMPNSNWATRNGCELKQVTFQQLAKLARGGTPS